MDAGINEMNDSEFGLEITCPVESFQKVLEVVKKYELEPESSGLEWVAKELVTLDEETSNKVSELYDELDDLDDVFRLPMLAEKFNSQFPALKIPVCDESAICPNVTLDS